MVNMDHDASRISEYICSILAEIAGHFGRGFRFMIYKMNWNHATYLKSGHDSLVLNSFEDLLIGANPTKADLSTSQTAARKRPWCCFPIFPEQTAIPITSYRNGFGDTTSGNTKCCQSGPKVNQIKYKTNQVSKEIASNSKKSDCCIPPKFWLQLLIQVYSNDSIACNHQLHGTPPLPLPGPTNATGAFLDNNVLQAKPAYTGFDDDTNRDRNTCHWQTMHYMYTLYIYIYTSSLYTILQMNIDANWSRQISTWKTPNESHASEMYYAFLAAIVYHKYNICYRYLSQCSDLVTCILTPNYKSPKSITQLLVPYVTLACLKSGKVPNFLRSSFNTSLTAILQVTASISPTLSLKTPSSQSGYVNNPRTFCWTKRGNRWKNDLWNPNIFGRPNGANNIFDHDPLLLGCCTAESSASSQISVSIHFQMPIQDIQYLKILDTLIYQSYRLHYQLGMTFL